MLFFKENMLILHFKIIQMIQNSIFVFLSERLNLKMILVYIQLNGGFNPQTPQSRLLVWRQKILMCISSGSTTPATLIPTIVFSFDIN